LQKAVDSPEEGVMFHGRFPQIFARSVAGQVESQQGVIALITLFSQLDKKLFSLERNLDNFRPAKRVDLDGVLKHYEADASYTKMDSSSM
jgi:hypothetical protein